MSWTLFWSIVQASDFCASLKCGLHVKVWIHILRAKPWSFTYVFFVLTTRWGPIERSERCEDLRNMQEALGCPSHVDPGGVVADSSRPYRPAFIQEFQRRCQKALLKQFEVHL